MGILISAFICIFTEKSIKKMENRSTEIRNKRKDLTPYLLHFIKGNNTPKAILSKILTEECLRSDQGVICFTEAPLTSCKEMFDLMKQYPRPMYTEFGIGLPRDLLYNLGARNIIYGKGEELKLFPEDVQWRCLEFEPKSYDFTWLREWRLHKSVFDFSQYRNDVFVITPTDCDLIEFTIPYDIDAEYEYEAGDDPTFNAWSSGYRTWKGISMEEIVKRNLRDDIEVLTSINAQILGKETDDVRRKLYEYLGF